VSRNFDVKRLIGDFIFLDVAWAFDTVWVNGLLYKIKVLNFFSYLVKAISSYLHGWKFEASFQTTTSTCRCVRAGMTQGGKISPIPFSLYVAMPVSSRHVELALYTDDMAIIATSSQPALLIKYQETYLRDLEWWLRK
jgi:hypothetical protein